VAQWHRLRWYGHVLKKDENDWVKKCMDFEVELEKVKENLDRGHRKNCQNRQLCKENAMDRRKWRKLIKDVL